MLNLVVRLKRRWKLSVFLGAVLVGLGVMFTSGFASDVATSVFARMPWTGGYSAPTEYYGPMTLEERIVIADVIARAKLHSVSRTTERMVHDNGESYVVALEFTFDALEYLKGSGGSQLKALAYDLDVWYETKLGASTLGEDFLSGRDKRWDDREAIVFLREPFDLPSAKQAGRYWLGYVRFDGGEAYTIANREYHPWLPDAATPTPVGGGGPSASASTVSGGDGQRFLLEDPASPAWAGGDSGQSGTGQTRTVTLSNLKAMIGRLQAEVAAGASSEKYAEEYRHCVFKKYQNAQEVRYTIARDGKYMYTLDGIDLASGLPEGRAVHSALMSNAWLSKHGEKKPSIYRVEDWVGGRDADIFRAGYPGIVWTARPLPSGEYRFFYYQIPNTYAICDGFAKEEKERHEILIRVTAPAGVLHEAFFDPAALQQAQGEPLAVGADGTNGVLKPASFTSDGATTTISAIEWGSQQITMNVSSSLPANHHVDFLALDASVALRLDVDDATTSVEGGVTKLTWGVCKQPWPAGDRLMLRIAQSPSNLTGVTNDTTCTGPTPTPLPAATPWPTATPYPGRPTPTNTPTPTPTPTVTPTPGPPGVPTGLTATGGDRSVTLAWDDPSDSSITGYEYQVNHNATGTGNFTGWGDWTAIPGSGASTTSHEVTGLTNGAEYRFHLRAVNASGAGGQAPNASPWYVSATPAVPTRQRRHPTPTATPTPTPTSTPTPGPTPTATPTATPTPVPAPPAAPAGLTATAGVQSVTLAWDDPSDSSITGYEYQMRWTGVAWQDWVAIPGSGSATTSHTIKGLTGGTEYRFHLRAVNASGTGVVAPNASPWYVSATPQAPPTPTPTPTPARR